VKTYTISMFLLIAFLCLFGYAETPCQDVRTSTTPIVQLLDTALAPVWRIRCGI
jgi:hypothetical protein